ncbi:MAG: hypothetical protein KDA53_03985 [Hyphomonas sp.]|nr:hypothetical protein [Hyphomonas sp.]
MDILTNREWAIVVWVVVFFALASLKTNLRKALGRVLKSFLNRHFAWLAGLLFAYVLACLILLHATSLWAFDQTKTTIVWLFLAAPTACFQVATADQQPHFFREWVQDTFKLTAIVEFVAFDTSLPFVVELILIPVVMIVVLLLAVAEQNEEDAPAAKLLNVILMLVGLLLILRGVWVIFQNVDSYANLSTVRDIYTVPLLSLSLIPFVYAVFLFSRYQGAFSPLRIYIPDEKLRDYAQAKAIIAFGKHTHLLDRWKRQMGTRKPRSRQEVDASIGEILRGHARDKKPNEVDPAFGWCPIQAGKFLSPFGLTTGDYHESDGEWFASSPPKEINDGLIPDNIAYYVEGNENAATVLKLVLNVNTQASPQQSEGYFAQLASALLNLSTGEVVDVERLLIQQKFGVNQPVRDATMVAEKELFRNQRNGGYSLRVLLRKGEV